MGLYIPAPEGNKSPGVAPGGLENQILAKASDLNYDTEWVDAPAGTGSGGTGPPTGPAGVVAATAPIAYDSGTQTVSTSMATNRLLGRSSAGAGVAQEISVGSGLSLSSGTLSATLGGTDLSYTASSRLLESSTGGDVTLPLFTGALAGLTPSSGGGTTNFLRADGNWAAPPGSGSVANYQEFLSSGTWTKPAGVTMLYIEVVSGGGGGGSGRRGASGGVRCGGGGGAGGNAVSRFLPASAAGATEVVTVGTGGPGGAARTTDSTSGVIGTGGGGSSFGSLVVTATSVAGSGGTTSTGTGGIASFAATNATVGALFSVAGGSASTTGGAGGNSAVGALCPGGGGGGGGQTSTGLSGSGGNGGLGFGMLKSTSGQNVFAGGGDNGTATNPGSNGPTFGDGGGAGGSGTSTAAAGDGGNGAIPGGGGGGGGGSTNGSNSGAGGSGAGGWVRIWSW